jgi:Ig-like domain from next to BRCA1 gene/Helix-turn-helix domain
MPRPTVTTRLDPRQPRSLLGWAMRELRASCQWDVTRAAHAFGCSPSHITRVELGQARPSRDLVDFYEQQFEGDGILVSLMEVVEHHAEQGRRRAAQSGIRVARAVPGDAPQLVESELALGTLIACGERFSQTWRIRNAGVVPWVGRQLERQGPRAGPGLIVSERRYPIPDTAPGEIATIQVDLTAPTYDCSTIAYFKMVDADGQLCFPDHQVGLDVLIIVRDEAETSPDPAEDDLV